MVHRWNGDRCRLHFAVSSQELLHGAKSFAFKLARHRVGASCIGIDNAEQAHGLALQLEFLVDSGMIAPEDAYAHNGD